MSTQTIQNQSADRFLQRDNVRLRWRLEGSGPAIVLLHGWPLDLSYWDPVAAQLARRFTVLRFDRCGFGLSTGRPDIHRNVADLCALLDAAALTRVVLVGMSQGARFAIHFERQQPLRTRALVLDGAPAVEVESELPLERFRNVLALHGLAALHTELLAHPFMRLQTNDPHIHQLLAEVVRRYRGFDLLQSSAHAPAPDLTAIAVPTLVLNGSLDSRARQAAGRSLQTAIPGSSRVELAGAGHLAALDDPAGYAAAVGEFVSVLPP
jgi:3-oxoadipate enol-lactonase